MGVFAKKNNRKYSQERMLKVDVKSNNPFLMFIILIIQRHYNLSDNQIEYQLKNLNILD